MKWISTFEKRTIKSNYHKMTNEPFRICLTMAGAVSAGAYTAGVIDYFLETLRLWEAEKAKGDPGIPDHEVKLEVISGASAGGIVGSLMLMSILEHNNEKLKGAWVGMADDEESDTLSKMLDHRNISDDDATVRSLLNTTPLELIANQFLNTENINAKGYPSYVSENLDLVLTVSNLRGLQFRIGFKGTNDKSGTTITNHGGFFRYRVKNEANQAGLSPENELYYVLDLENDQDLRYLKSATLSTSAFPLGFESRNNVIPKAYLERYARSLFPDKDNIEPIIPDEDLFRFSSVDGGLINNEPFGYALRILKDKHSKAIENDQYAIIMINPFPSFDRELPKHKPDLDLISVGRMAFTALRNQVMFKQDDILAAFDDAIRTRFLIAPRRKEKKLIDGVEEWPVAKNPLACGALAGFSGFIDQSFRQHDFDLGRQNCQSFLRYHFSLPVEDLPKKLNRPISKEAIDRFSFSIPPYDESGKRYFPIIPDVRVKKAFDNTYDTDHYPDASIPYPKFPSISIDEIEARYKEKAMQRIGTITPKYLNINRFVNTVVHRYIRKEVYRFLLKSVREGLEDHELLEEGKKKSWFDFFNIL